MKINVVGVCGLYRTGKSYLMNWIAGEKTGFNLGVTTQSETKGIWIWCRLHPTQLDQVLVLLDTEGLDDPEKGDPEHDSNMFCLTLLMSSTLIINVKSVFDYSTLDKLAFIASLSDTIKILDDEAEDKHNAKTIQVASPTLIMCIRDFFLENTKDGKLRTATEYLEDNLKPVQVSTLPKKQQQNQEKFNTIKEYIKNYFPKRKCFTIAQPALGENLKEIEKLDETSLAKSFVENIKELQSYVYDRKPKYICNASKKPLDGSDLTSLITFYVNSLRKGSPLKCQDAYGQASVQRNERVLQKVLTKFKKDMEKFKNIRNKEELQNKFLPTFDRVNSAYREGSFVYLQNEYEEKLMAEMTAHLDMMKNEISKTCMEKGTKKLSKMYDDMLRKNKSRYMTGETAYCNYETDMEQLKQEFFEAKKKYDKDVLFKCFDEFTKSKSDDKMTLYRIATGQKNKGQYDKIQNEINNRMGCQLERILMEEHGKRNLYLEKELAELKANYDEL
ncbi:guanylate-binding protein 1-like, partial [Ruditapes philippinarum]|uniref:guanylate-binding protein 1-like n=1 Tax=Ruditapes philippinarum TaxID=129788 RepID=UPI00295AB7B8